MTGDYEALGLVAGIEIHQQLNTKEKLFCRCPTTIRETEESNGEFFRLAARKQMGGRPAAEEMMQIRQFSTSP